MSAQPVEGLRALQAIVLEALDERRGLVAFSKIEALEMDRLAREYERRALDRLREALARMPEEAAALAVRQRLARMEEQLAELEGQTGIAETSRRLQRDEITWRAFEDVAALLGVEA